MATSWIAAKGLVDFLMEASDSGTHCFFCTVPTTVFALLLIFSDLCTVQYVYTGYIYIIYIYIYIYIHTYIIIQMGRIRDEKKKEDQN